MKKSKVVAVVNKKGGVGKTTTVGHLAILAMQDNDAPGQVVVIETDESTSLRHWVEGRKTRAKQLSEADATSAFLVPKMLIANDYGNPDRLKQAVAGAIAAGVEWVFIDTAAGACALHTTAVDLADFVLIPVTLSIRDMQVTIQTIDMVKGKRKRASLFMSKGSPSKAQNDAVVLALSARGIPGTSTHIVERTPTQKTERTSETLMEMDAVKDTSVRNGQEEYRALWHWLRSQFDEIAAED